MPSKIQKFFTHKKIYEVKNFGTLEMKCMAMKIKSSINGLKSRIDASKE